MKLTTRRILKEADCNKLDLAKGEGYWYFIYSDKENNLYATHSVYTVQLNALTLEQWKDEANEFLATLKTSYPDKI